MSAPERCSYDDDEDDSLFLSPGIFFALLIFGLLAVIYIYLFRPIFWWAEHLYLLSAHDAETLTRHFDIESPHKARWHAHIAWICLILFGISVYVAIAHYPVFGAAAFVLATIYAALTLAFYRNQDEDHSYGF